MVEITPVSIFAAIAIEVAVPGIVNMEELLNNNNQRICTLLVYLLPLILCCLVRIISSSFLDRLSQPRTDSRGGGWLHVVLLHKYLINAIRVCRAELNFYTGGAAAFTGTVVAPSCGGRHAAQVGGCLLTALYQGSDNYSTVSAFV